MALGNVGEFLYKSEINTYLSIDGVMFIYIRDKILVK